MVLLLLEDGSQLFFKMKDYDYLMNNNNSFT